MSASLQAVFVVFFVGCLAAAYWLLNSKRKPRVLPPPPSKRAEPPFQQTNGLAKLFVEVLALKETAVAWPIILQKLNSEEEPHIRTLLLELRSHGAADPDAVLKAIESTCIAAKREGESPSRSELLERTLAVLHKGIRR